MSSSPEDGSAPFLERLLDEAVGPFFVEFDDTPDIVVDIPDVDDIAELDFAVSVTDQLDLVAGETTADALLDLYDERPASDLAELVDDIREHFGLLIAPDEGWGQLVYELNRYGAAIERDLMDIPNAPSLYDWVRDHRNLPWNKLIRLLDKMPDGGWYNAALASDIERAEQILELEENGELPKPSTRPSLIGWNTTTETLTEVVETLRRIEHAVWGSSPKFKGKGGKPPKNFPRPLTARERAKELRSFREHDEIASQLLGDRYTPILAPHNERQD